MGPRGAGYFFTRNLHGRELIRSPSVNPHPGRAARALATLAFVAVMAFGTAAVTKTGSRAIVRTPPPGEVIRIEQPPPNIYAAAGAGMLSPSVRDVPYRVYVPN